MGLHHLRGHLVLSELEINFFLCYIFNLKLPLTLDLFYEGDLGNRGDCGFGQSSQSAIMGLVGQWLEQ